MIQPDFPPGSRTRRASKALVAPPGFRFHPAVLARFLAFIRFSHTVFALPFAAGSMWVAAGGWPGWRTAALVVLATVLARTAAMLFNRLADWEIDKRNPRTAARHRLVPRPVATAAFALASAGFLASAWSINALCFVLSPVALALICFYSVTKRFTSASHFVLGLALAIAPVGAWIAVTGAFALPPLVLAASVLCWVAGFDLIYATQDEAFDREEGLHSLVVRIGRARSLAVARALHLAMAAGLAGFGALADLGVGYWILMAPVLGALWWEHAAVRRGDDAALRHAFFTSNAVVSALFVAACIAG